MDGQTVPERPDGFLWCGKLLEAALEPASWNGPRSRRRKDLPAFRVMFTLVRQDLDAGGNGAQPLYHLAATTTLAVGYLISEASRHFGTEPEQVASGLAGEFITAHVGRVLAGLYDGTFDRVLVDVLAEASGESFFDLLGDLTELAAMLVLGVADREGVRPAEIVQRLQRMAEDSC
ncbi:hypothetical protein GXW82_04735 [Streptacidiphilus sp. 4-A2]|nr:hypothetical protein [Streptacidiphilus sp. 4-A2]